MSKLQKIAALVAGVAATAQAYALEPAPVEMGGFQMIPTLSVATGHDDNPFSAQDGEEESMMVSTIAPSVQFLAQQQDNIYSLDLGVTRGIFHDSTSDNYTDFNLSGAAQIVLNARNRFDLGAGVFSGHEDRGTGGTQGLGAFIEGPTEYDDTTLGGKYTFGAQSAKARLEFTADYLEKEFDRSGPLGAAVANRDREDAAIGARLLYAVSADTDVTVELRSTDADYTSETRPRSLDNVDQEVFVGAEWDATGKTSGYAKIGYSRKDFDTVFREDNSTVNWAAGIVWEPRTYSVVTFTTSRDEEETTGTGNFIDTISHGVNWTHAWNEQVSTDVAYNLRQEEYVGSAQDDDTDSFSAKVTYAYDRWLDIGLGFDYTDKSSTVSALDFDRNKIVLSFDLSL